MSNYRNKLEEYLKTLNIKADKVLDVGGAAKPVKGRVKSWEVKLYECVDNGLEEGRKTYLGDLNVPNLWQTEGLLLNEPYDCVFCLEVMEYIYKPTIAVGNLADITQPNGILYITFPFLYPVHEPRDYDYMRYTRAGVTHLLTEAGFKILDIVDRNMKPESYAMWRAFIASEGMHASRGYTSHDSLGVIVKAQKI
jgi:SAM-dependent methyltransferase